MSRLSVRNTGLVCPVGLTALTACAAIRCNITAIEEIDMADAYGEPYYASMMPDLPRTLGARQRTLTLLARVLSQAAAPIAHAAPLGIILVLPDLLAEFPLDLWWHELTPNFQSAILNGHPRVLFGGPVRAVEALENAWELLSVGEVKACVVAAADSLVTARRILELTRQGRLQRPECPDGVIPGEAAACVVLDRYRQGELALLGPVGLACEPATLWNDEPHRADGLVAAAERALATTGCQFDDIDARISNAAGESFDFREQALLVSRMLNRRKASLPLLSPCAMLGDVGVAGPLCALVKAVASYQLDYAAGPKTLVLARDHLAARGESPDRRVEAWARLSCPNLEQGDDVSAQPAANRKDGPQMGVDRRQ